MGHDEHFLARLDRVSEVHVERALSLYRNERLVRFLIGRANVPDGDRIAISLDRAEGPFVVLAQDGHFVTCLGRGMFPTGLRVLSNRWLDEAIADYATYRKGLDRGRERTAGNEGGLFNAVAKRAHAFDREDFAALRTVAEFLGPIWFEWFRTSSANTSRYLAVAESSRNFRSPLKDDQLDAYWKGAWAASHCAVLGACAGEEAVLEFAKSWPVGDYSPTAFSWLPDVHVLHVRATWLVAQYADTFLPLYERMLRVARSDHTVADAVTVLMAMAVRWPSMRKPIVRILMDREVPAARVPARDAYRTLALKYIDDPDAADEAVLAGGRFGVREWCRVSPDEVSEEFVRAYGIVMPSDVVYPLLGMFDEPWRGAHRMAAIASAARRDAEILFLPASELRRTPLPPHVEVARASVRRCMKSNRDTAPVGVPTSREGPRTGRNEPCPCGSGKKLKKCCAEVRSGRRPEPPP